MKRTIELAGRGSIEIEGSSDDVELTAELISMGAALRRMYFEWTEDDESEGDCDNSGSGADVAAQVFAILTNHGYKVN